MRAMGLPEPRPAVRALLDEAVRIRRDLHRNAELSFEEHRTQALILERLRALGLDDVRAMNRTGATAIVRGALPGPNLLWRADIDALPLTEDTGLPFASENGAMHACGHDGHAAIALALAEALQSSRERLAGTVRFAFEPAEERIGGAIGMIEEGVLEEPRVDRVYGLHLWASTPLGQALVRPGPVFAAATHFRIIVRGRGGHAAAPHETVDPIVVAAHVVTALQTVVSRSVDPADEAVLTIGRIEGGVRGNVIPESVMMSGTVRTYEERAKRRVLQRMEEILAGVTSAFGATYQFDQSTLDAVVNDPTCAATVAAAASAFLGAENVGEGRAMGGDDMCYFLQRRPGAYFMLGAQPREKRAYPHHHPKFDFDEAAIGLGVEVALRIIETDAGCAL
jgi:amidohydrolase